MTWYADFAPLAALFEAELDGEDAKPTVAQKNGSVMPLEPEICAPSGMTPKTAQAQGCDLAVNKRNVTE